MMERTQKQTKNLTEGSPARLILEFAVPMFLGLLFQQFYSMVDTMIVGKFLGMKPLAGVGATGSLNFMVIGFCIGVCNGFAIPVAQKLGAKDYSALRRFVANATWLCLAFSVVMTVIVSILCGDILRFMKTPEDIFSYTYWYMLIIFLGIPCTFLYNILAALIRSLGDSKTPVIFLALASVLNIGLDLVFIIVFRMGVKGAALATLRVVLSVVYWKAFSNPAGNERRVETVAKVYDAFMCGWNPDGNAVFDHSDRNTCDPGSSERFWIYSGSRSDGSE